MGQGTPSFRLRFIPLPEFCPPLTSIGFTARRPAPSPHLRSLSFRTPLASPVLPLFHSPNITVLSVCSSYSTRLPMGTIGFSRVLRRNFSLKLSGVLWTPGLKPSMTGGCDGSKGVSGVTGPGVAMSQVGAVGENRDAKPRLLIRS